MNLPDDFIIRTKRWLGEEYARLEKALQEDETPVSIRFNPAKQTTSEFKCEKIKWCETGYYLSERPSFTFDPLFHAGCYYVQEASSMFLEQVVKQYITTPVVCLDLCAAPGGKSTHLSSLLPEKSLLVSNEVIHSRANILKENLIKWGAPHTVVTCNDPKEIGRLTHLFDVIVADLPCSGEGMFRKDQHSRNEWSVANVRLCAARQRRIIHDVWDSLKPGGLLVYSTCTFNREENEDNIRYLIKTLSAEVLPVSIEKDWDICHAIDASFPFYRFYPHKIMGEGFCLAVLRKPDGKLKSIRIHNAKFNSQNAKSLSQFYELPFIQFLLVNACTLQ
jgi:16S rRNA C967 or C1407 C5-methylase (RsmB/RsmF family)